MANWKLNPTSEVEAIKLAKAEDFKNVIIAPPFPFLKSVGGFIRNADLGAQDVFWKEEGAYTGEVSASQLKSLGVNYVIIGHFERRALGETDEIVNKKIKAALQAGLKIILCVGENWSIRRKGLAAAKKFVKNQLQKDLGGIKNLIVAYEPVWAIGTGKSDKPSETVEMVKFIKKILNAKVLYGGSVNSKNAKSFLDKKEISGALVGGASLNAKEFKKIIRIASET